MDKLVFALSLLLPGTLGSLPDTFTPRSYDLSLTVTSDLNSAVVGAITITLACAQNTSVIVLHWGSSIAPTTPSTSDLTVRYSPPGSTVDPVTIAYTPSLGASNQLILTTTPASGQTFISGGTVTIEVTRFQTRINRENKGLFYRQYMVEYNQNNTMLLTNLMPTFARELFPCLDEPRFSPTLTLTLTYPTTWSVAASSTLRTTTADPTVGTTTVAFKPITIPANTFALFFAENMVPMSYSVERSTTTLTFWSRKNLAYTTFAQNVRFLSEYYYMVEDVLGTDFAQPLTVVMVPGLEESFSGYGIIFIREDNYAQDYSSPQLEGLYKANVAPVIYQFLRQFSEFSTWPSSWSDNWVSQAVNKYLQYLILNTVMPMFDFKTDLEVVDRQTALYLDSQYGAKPLQETLVNTDSTASVQTLINDPLKSLKGASILNMLDQSFPAGAVFAAIKSFLTANKRMPITTATFINAIQTIQSSPTLSPYARSALTQTLAYWFGNTMYPLETVQLWSPGTPGVVNFTTTGYCSALDPSCNTTLSGLYYLSATVGSRSDNRYYTPRQDFWVTNNDPYRSTNINVKDTDWVVANMKSGGYYRSNYNVNNWEFIINALSSGDQNLLSRTQLLDDAFALALSSANALDYNITVRLALANFRSTLYRDWVPVQRGLRDIQNNLLGLESYTAYKNFAAGYFLNLNAFLQNQTYDAFEKARITALFLEDMCEYDITGYRASATGNLTVLLKGDLPNTVPSSAYDALACCGSRYNSTLRAQTLWNILADSTLNYYSRRFASIALGCLSNYTDIAQLFNTMTVVNVQLKPYIQIALEKVAEKNPVDSLNDLTQQINKFQSQLGAASVASLIVRAGRKINNNTQAAVLDNIINSNANVDSVVRTAAQDTKNRVSYKVTWLSQNSARLVSALKTYTLPSGAASGANILAVMSLLVFLPSILLMLVPGSV